jgi:hypothetical protein
MTIFGRRDNERVEVPEIEVHGDEATVANNDEAQDADRPDRRLKLPKTKWF